MKKNIAVGAAVVAIAVAATAFQSPVTQPQVVRPFGTPSWGDYALDIRLAGDSEGVRAIADGEILFTFVQDFSDPFPSTLGSFVALVHEDDIVAVHPHLASDGMRSTPFLVGEGEFLGAYGASGIAGPGGVSLFVYDARRRRFANPISLFPELGDTIPPVARNFRLRGSASTWTLGDRTRIPQGTYDLVADIYDLCSAAQTKPGAPYSIRFTLDGVRKGDFVFESAGTKEGRTAFFSEPRVFDVFWNEDGSCELGTFLLARGGHELWVSVTDYSGNEKTVRYEFVVE